MTPAGEFSGRRDEQTVDAAGHRLGQTIDGVVVRAAVAHVDGRGLLTEIWRRDWGTDTEDAPQCYLFTLRPGVRKGWVMHTRQYDRQFLVSGTVRVALCDVRRSSPTFRLRQDVFLSVEARKLVIVPPRVLHAVENIGRDDAVMINLPTRLYDYESPDKYRWSDPIDSPPDVAFDG
jgi:dTDP-4-dehydrorhamnose 3,5-epimerase